MRRTLVIDDERDVADSLVLLLEVYGGSTKLNIPAMALNLLSANQSRTAMAGKSEVKAQPGQGAAFEFLIPLAHPQVSSPV